MVALIIKDLYLITTKKKKKNILYLYFLVFNLLLIEFSIELFSKELPKFIGYFLFFNHDEITKIKYLNLLITFLYTMFY